MHDTKAAPDMSPGALPPWPLLTFYSIFIWAIFLLALEPGNMIRAARDGRPLGIFHEVERLFAASLLAAAATPALIMFSSKFPLTLLGPRRNWAIFAGLVVLLDFLLLIISCFLAAWIFGHRLLPTTIEITTEFADNWLLVFFGLLSVTAIGHASALRRQRMAASLVDRRFDFPVNHQGRQSRLAADAIDWVETHGNYLALHAGQQTYLLRETLTSFEGQVDPARFVRIHRCRMVALDRILDLAPLGNGDATVRLTDGTKLRVSRSYRKRLRAQWQRLPA